MRVLGIEGTAWAASAALFDPETDDVSIESDAYQPETGGIHPREAAEHMRTAIPAVVETVLDETGEGGIDAVAFSQGPGLGPCLRIAGTAARALALSLDVPLVGVNHMLAHAEIGRHRSNFDSPICLNTSGANAHVLGFVGGRYRILGETMDTGIGNALDKFTRHLDWSHPGGPKVERAARAGSYTDLPYVVTGMDFSFSGIMSAAKEAVDDGVPVEDVCFSLQETTFAMLTEVAERALALTGKTELVLGGGVGQNARLQAMLGEMCAARGAEFFAPEARFLQDNAGMIAVLGARMAEAGETIPVESSRIDSGFRPDQVAVTWRDPDPPRQSDPETDHQGAEAVVEFEGDRVVKRRLPKSYRHPTLDDRLRRERVVEEARLTSAARRLGVPTPVVDDVDTHETRLALERVGDADLRDRLEVDAGAGTDRVRAVADHLARLHDSGIVHGDPTTRNVRVSGETADDGRTYLIDFGLGYYTDAVEDHAMDCHVFEQSLSGTATEPDRLREAFEARYAERGDREVLDRLREIEGRGRYQ
ncbi:bifunctional N(6)-L-threonylcarbamoyladenine synthase/serine/threonine protein kinase [Halococcus sp. IIIV-5B]|uniref:bifunctional N(6)-L-threonylcarbamoyladenine synthase/serine/threonine protein kinase n=1 Tax=Halococcus sp. IIIV-5B TaxID=2321230 RepID=UPI000E7723A7|nr:bifunctional N(6)-L-threonylcarbamoyladenine synthase/serine/threonine protein kinase [Halococcus sp. IIIV-5B]RJT02719.1 bifunctional N(6)-L-threonylcarbamoyladenine synthase/serine/threonine protein kinase [Halococcus sp. IIIV-5B]